MARITIESVKVKLGSCIAQNVLRRVMFASVLIPNFLGFLYGGIIF